VTALRGTNRKGPHHTFWLLVLGLNFCSRPHLIEARIYFNSPNIMRFWFCFFRVCVRFS
jgi:hypothetical protein